MIAYRRHPWIAAFLATLLPAAALAAAATELPQGVAFRLDGEDLSQEALFRFVGAEYRAAKEGRELLETYVQEVVVELEARRRGLSVTDRELEERFQHVDRQTRQESKGARDLTAVLKEQGVSETEFRLLLRRSILLEKVARQDFGQANITDAKVNLWLQDRMQRAVVQTSGLPHPLIARVDGEEVTLLDFGRRYLAQFSPGDPRARAIEDEFLRHEIAFRAARALGVTLSDADVERALRERERTLQREPGFAGVTLDAFLRKTGTNEAELRVKPSFRAHVLLLRVVDEVLFPGPDLYWFYRSHQAAFDHAFGPTAEIATIFLKAGAEGAAKAGFVPRAFEDAEAELTALRRRIEAGQVEFAAVAKARSEHDSSRAGGRLGRVNSASGDLAPLAHAALEADPEATLVGPVRTVDGVHLVQILGRFPKPGFMELRETIRRQAANTILNAAASRARVERR